MEMPPVKKRQGTNKLPFGSILRRIIDERSLSIKAVAEMAGVRPSVVQSWISAANPHDLHAVAKLAKALDMNFKELLLGEKDFSINIEADDFFEEQDFFDGICRIKIQRLIPKKGK